MSKRLWCTLAFAMLAGGCARAAEDPMATCAGSNDPVAVVEACTTVIEASSSKPDWAYAHLYRGLAMNALGDLEGAVAELDIAVALAPKDSMVIANRGALHNMQDNLDAGLRDLEAALRLDPNNALAIGNRGIVHEKRGEFDAALADVDRALVLDPKAYQLWGERCWIGAATAKDLQRALQDCNKAIDLAPPDEDNNYNSRGLALYRVGRHAEAIADYDRAIKGNPYVASSYLVRGLAKRALKMEGAQADIDKGKAMDKTVGARYASYGVDTD